MNHRLTVVLDHFTEFALVGTQAINLQVDTQTPLHAISLDIYGVQPPQPLLPAKLSYPSAAGGGNNSARYNWQIGKLGRNQLGI